VSWHDQTHGGDWSTVDGEAELTQIAPDPSGGFIAIGNGRATVTYHSAYASCTVRGSPWTAPYMVTIQGHGGNTAEVDIDDMDEPHQVTLLGCLANGQPTYDADSPGLPTVTVELREGSTPFSEDHAGDHGAAGDAGTVTLHYCTPDRPNGR
jgi:hypothetical protein